MENKFLNPTAYYQIYYLILAFSGCLSHSLSSKNILALIPFLFFDFQDLTAIIPSFCFYFNHFSILTHIYHFHPYIIICGKIETNNLKEVIEILLKYIRTLCLKIGPAPNNFYYLIALSETDFIKFTEYIQYGIICNFKLFFSTILYP